MPMLLTNFFPLLQEQIPGEQVIELQAFTLSKESKASNNAYSGQYEASPEMAAIFSLVNK